ncbi:MAG TPA: hypothetical protein VE291_05385 [Terracidiphilus sp.]|nr:hypothetical protein [Terracidiphilus sp.]
MDFIELGVERQNLTEVYRAKWDEELRVLAEEFDDLTEMAQQVLREELQRRGLGKPGALVGEREPARGTAGVRSSDDDQLTTDGKPDEDDPDDGLPYELTWKTPLCDCESREEAWQRAEMLKRAGIESWIDAPDAYALDLSGPRVMVAADQLEQARAIAAQPVPQDIIDQSKVEMAPPEPFALPNCPGCGAADPLLAGIEPVNQWQCEVCGREWSDPAPSAFVSR